MLVNMSRSPKTRPQQSLVDKLLDQADAGADDERVAGSGHGEARHRPREAGGRRRPDHAGALESESDEQAATQTAQARSRARQRQRAHEHRHAVDGDQQERNPVRREHNSRGAEQEDQRRKRRAHGDTDADARTDERHRRRALLVGDQSRHRRVDRRPEQRAADPGQQRESHRGRERREHGQRDERAGAKDVPTARRRRDIRSASAPNGAASTIPGRKSASSTSAIACEW